MFTPNGEIMSCWRWVSTQHRESRVHHSLHGMSVPHTISEKQMLESYHPLTSRKTPAEVRLQQRRPPTRDVCGHCPEAGGPNYTTHFCLAWTIKAEVRGQWCEMESRRDRKWSRTKVVLMKAPSLRAAGSKKQQGHRGIKPPPLTGPAQLPPGATGPPALTQNPPCRCMAGKRKKKSTERKSWKPVLPSKWVRLKDKTNNNNNNKTHQNKRVSEFKRQF